MAFVQQHFTLFRITLPTIWCMQDLTNTVKRFARSPNDNEFPEGLALLDVVKKAGFQTPHGRFEFIPPSLYILVLPSQIFL